MTDSPLSSYDTGVIIPVNDARYPSRNIRLSAALCCLGFSVKHDNEPCTVSIDADTQRRVVVFWHTPTLPPDSAIALNLAKQNIKLLAIDVDAWWRTPGKYSIEGYDDALQAMRRVQEAREWLLGVVHGSRAIGDARLAADSVATTSLHIASAIRACDVRLLGYENKSRQFIFGRDAAPIAEYVARDAGRDTIAREGKDLCIDWMLWALKYRDWLFNFVRNPECIPLIEMRDGDRTLQVSATMPERDRNRLIARL